MFDRSRFPRHSLGIAAKWHGAFPRSVSGVMKQEWHANQRTFRSSSRVGYGRPYSEEYLPDLGSSGPLSEQAPDLQPQRIRVTSVWRGVPPLQSSSAKLRLTGQRGSRASRG